MRHYQSIPDACFGMIMLLAGLETALMAYGNVDLLQLEVQGETYVPSLLAPFGLLVLSCLVARWQLVRSGVRWWAYLGMLLPTLWVIFFSGNWFTTGFHDLAGYYFESHGRFGCHDEYYSGYIFRDTTAPWILHGPLFAATVGHWIHACPVARKILGAFVTWFTTYEARATTA